MRVAVIGGTGHIGTYLIPRLVDAGFETISISRGVRQPYVESAAWRLVERIVLDRDIPQFETAVASLGAGAVIDLTCYTPESAHRMVEALRGRNTRLLHCGTIWVHGMSVEVPTTEDCPRLPISDYGKRKARIESFLLEQSGLEDGVPSVVIHPGHLVGQGWIPLNPAANFNPRVFRDLAAGREIALPNFGRETLHHVHAADVAQCFVRALTHWIDAEGKSFHAVSRGALTMAGYAEAVASWYGHQARIRFLSWEEWRATVTEREAEIAWDHIARSPHCSIARAQALLGYEPRYTSLEAIQEALFSALYPG
ncbi:MAG TPA: NAD-dependent epimerase/dehydratase family protein [Bryobacteraceae bacterium]|nr:NAD-dependent epimerase/dehydratase family protein [Bryobacteraceae bacterium]